MPNNLHMGSETEAIESDITVCHRESILTLSGESSVGTIADLVKALNG